MASSSIRPRRYSTGHTIPRATTRTVACTTGNVSQNRPKFVPIPRAGHWASAIAKRIREGTVFASDSAGSRVPDFYGSIFHHGRNFYARAYDLADEAALHLIAVIEVLTRALPSHPINLICHSLGSRVVIRAIAKMAKDPAMDDPAPGDQDLAKPEPEYRPSRPDLLQRLNKILLLAGAEKVMEAQLMMGRLNGYDSSADKPHFYNFVSRETTSWTSWARISPPMRLARNRSLATTASR